jgi:hypothetical protein
MAPTKDPLFRLGHIQTEIESVLIAVAGRPAAVLFVDYASTRMIERAIQIISEAAKELPPDVRAMTALVPLPSGILASFVATAGMPTQRKTAKFFASRDAASTARAA